MLIRAEARGSVPGPRWRTAGSRRWSRRPPSRPRRTGARNMCVCIYIYIYIYIHTYTYIHTYIYMYQLYCHTSGQSGGAARFSICLSCLMLFADRPLVRILLQRGDYIYIYIVFMYIYIYIYTHIYTNTCISIYIYIYTHI